MGLEYVPKPCYVSSDRTLIHYITTKTLNYFLLENMGIMYHRPTYCVHSHTTLYEADSRRKIHPVSADLNTERKSSLKDKNVNLICVISKGNICIFNHQYPVSCLLRIQIDL